MKAMILAAGRGTRLAPLTDRTPKPLLPVHGIPLIERQLRQLVAAGITEVVINLFHLGEQIVAHLGDGRSFGARIQYSRESELLETAGGIRQALPLLGNAPFVLLNGDIYTDFDFARLPAAPADDCGAHLVLTPTPAHRGGDFESDGRRVTARGEPYVYMGIGVVRPEAFASYPPGPFSFQTVMFDLLAEARLCAQVHAGEWHDIGSLAQYEAVQAMPPLP